jgi:hypothetical protein
VLTPDGSRLWRDLTGAKRLAPGSAGGPSGTSRGRLIEVIQDLVNRGDLKKDAFDAAVMSAKLSYAAARDSHKEYEDDGIRATFK